VTDVEKGVKMLPDILLANSKQIVELLEEMKLYKCYLWPTQCGWEVIKNKTDELEEYIVGLSDILYEALCNAKESYWQLQYVKPIRNIPDFTKSPFSKLEVHSCRDGFYQTQRIMCPDCNTGVCPHCEGTGKAKNKLNIENYNNFLASALDATDNPDSILENIR